ncbi:hypothetical protein QEJ31_14260 [Pigmentibacter sp. JX0631]|uniref:hypothetical protein n=1 Tax=Pigmentibacter sp. JX0631 TaxID=2976982 RepID=UPI0024688A9A|nr:hypothetical protein [Pigmentibacter sp. JX0631]WGL59692.1 hypothetical protein QEJ31_14260 [Pigmentibacter sp. JX0631]
MHPKLIATFIFIYSLFIFSKAFSHNNYYIYCANSKKDWKWLKDSSQNYIPISGVYKETKYKIHKGLGRYHTWIIRYLEVTELNADQKIQNFQEMCVNNFGSDYHFLQAAKDKFSPWIPLVVNKKDLARGYYELDIFRDEAIYEPSLMLRVVPVKETILKENLNNNFDLNILLYINSYLH